MQPSNSYIEQLLQWTTQHVERRVPMRQRFAFWLRHFPAQPQFKMIKVAGTNGKGSVCAMLSACLVADEQCVGMFTSPHLMNMRERFRVNDVEIEDELLNQYAGHLLSWLKAMVDTNKVSAPSFFEALILLAIQYFNDCHVKIAIFEAGVGGSSDAVSLLSDEFSIITSIGMDHADKLGNSLNQIAIDKAGIARNGARLFVANTISDELFNIIQQTAAQNSVTCDRTEQLVHFQGIQNYQTLVSIDYSSVQSSIANQSFALKPSLQGHFQLENINTIAYVWHYLHQQNIARHLSSVMGMEQSIWQGRFEIIKTNINHQKRTWLIDAAHNPPALTALTNALNRISQHQDRILILGISKGKSIADLLQIVPSISYTIFLVDDFYNATPSDVLAAQIIDSQPRRITIGDILSEISSASFDNKLIVVTGSIYMIGQVRQVIISEKTKN